MSSATRNAMLLAAGHFLLLLAFFAPAISTPDANSYFTQARLIAETGGTGFSPASTVQFIGPHWRPARDGRYYCEHPPGLPLILALPHRWLSADAALLVNPLFSSLALLGLFFLVSAWLGERWGLLAAAMMAFNSFANEHALFGDAHAIEAFLLVWTWVLLERGARRPTLAGAFAAGLMAGMMPVARYAEAAFLPGLAWLAWRAYRRSPPALAAAALGAALPIAGLLLRNHAVYGGWLRTGYGPEAGFGLGFLLRHFLPFLAMLLTIGGGPIFIAGAIGLRRLTADRSERERGLILLSLALPSTVLYMSYSWPPDPQSMRFLIPTFFVYVVSATWLLKDWTERSPRHRTTIFWGALAVCALWGLPRTVLSLAHLRRVNAAVTRARRMLESKAEPGAVVVGPYGLLQDLERFGRWRLADAGRAEHSVEELRRWAGTDSAIYWVVKERDASRLPAGLRLDEIARIKLVNGRFPLPEPPQADLPDPPGPMGPNRIFDLRFDDEPLLLFRSKPSR